MEQQRPGVIGARYVDLDSRGAEMPLQQSPIILQHEPNYQSNDKSEHVFRVAG